jgi:uncharacterized LabA/DUF88 family protein
MGTRFLGLCGTILLNRELIGGKGRAIIRLIPPTAVAVGRRVACGWPVIFFGDFMICNVYVDGFNFYYGCFKDRNDKSYAALQSLKWVDIRKLSETLRPGDAIKRIHYCTARVDPTPRDPDQPVRQEMYLNALKTTQGLKLHFGTFKSRPKWGMVIGPPTIVKQIGPNPQLAQIMTSEEKGSDVNIATHLLHDAFTGDCEAALVITNDSDLVEAIRTARVSAGIEVHLVSPGKSVTSTLRKAATSAMTLDSAVTDQSGKYLTKSQLLSVCQFPSPIVLPDGRALRKPRSW